jgi:carbamoyltransferase
MPHMVRLYTQFDEADWLAWLLPREKIPYGRRPLVYYVPHHVAHAASAFWTSGFEEAAILVIDGYGETEATTIAAGTATGMRILKTWDVTQSLGNFYEEATRWAGFSAWDAGKFMGLAAYGTAKQALPRRRPPDISSQTARRPIASRPPNCCCSDLC